MTVSKLTKSTDVYEVQQKTNEIIDGYLPLTGGTLTGDLYLQSALVRYNSTTEAIEFVFP